MRPRAQTFPLLLLLLLPSCIPSTYVILPAVRGRVIAADRSPVPHATLTVSDAFNHSAVATVITDADGRFSHPPVSRGFLYFPGMDFYVPPYTVSITTGPYTTPPASAPLGPEVHIFALTASDTPLDLGDLTFVSPTSPLLIPRRSSRTTKPAASAPAAARGAAPATVPVPAPVRGQTAAPASRPVPPDPDPEFTAWLAENAPDKLYPPGTGRTEILGRFPHPRVKGVTDINNPYTIIPLSAGGRVGPGIPEDLHARAVKYDEFRVARLIGSIQLLFIDRVFYDADDRVLGTNRYHAR